MELFTKAKSLLLVLFGLLISPVTLAYHYNLTDYGAYFQDNETHLDWLDLTVTEGQSVCEVASRLSTDLSGWRFATIREYEILTYEQGWLDFAGPTTSFSSELTPGFIGLMVRLFRNQEPSPEVLDPTHHWDAVPGVVGNLVDTGFYYGSLYKDEYDWFSEVSSTNWFDELHGTFLVRNHVPEPDAFFLLLGGGALIILRRRICK